MTHHRQKRRFRLVVGYCCLLLMTEFSGFCSGLADALHGTGVHLLVVRPGFVIGRMTEGMEPAPFSCTPAQVATAAARALRKGRRAVWVPAPLGLLAFAFRMTPRFVWRMMPR